MYLPTIILNNFYANLPTPGDYSRYDLSPCETEKKKRKKKKKSCAVVIAITQHDIIILSTVQLSPHTLYLIRYPNRDTIC